MNQIAMPETNNERKVFTLPEVCRSIQKTLADRYTSSFWVQAEMNKLNFYKHSGHCYPELVEKREGKVIALVKATLWKGDYQNINRNFLSTLKEPLKDGIKILFLARVGFDAMHGLTLQILDIDPSYTLGDLEREKQETITRLQEEHIFALNKSRTMPLLPKRIAIISVETSKGYADFLKVLTTNTWNYSFFHMLFPSLLQGEKAVAGIIAQLERIKRVKHHFDVVAIIRGGGGDVGLSCYNHYELAKAIAEFPIPVITGIGHATNETVTEMVSYQNAITPTKIAEFLIQKFHNFSVPVQKAQQFIAERALRMLAEAQNRVDSESKLFRSVTATHIARHRNETNNIRTTINQQSQFLLKNQSAAMAQYAEWLKLRIQMRTEREHMSIAHLESKVRTLDPVNILKRGYSITLYNGKALKNSESVPPGAQIETHLAQGEISSTVNTTK